jgi:hypothetical protein
MQTVEVEPVAAAHMACRGGRGDGLETDGTFHQLCWWGDVVVVDGCRYCCEGRREDGLFRMAVVVVRTAVELELS